MSNGTMIPSYFFRAISSQRAAELSPEQKIAVAIRQEQPLQNGQYLEHLARLSQEERMAQGRNGR